MYGYVRPEKGELKVREYETFRGVYCGLCHTLKKRYGPLLRFAVNYDLAFLAMLLEGPEPVTTCPKRCPYHPLRTALCPGTSEAMDAAADYTVILAYWKLRDGAEDRPFVPGFGYRFLAWLIKSAYRKAAVLRPEFASVTETELAALGELERQRCPGVDPPADRFARILAAAGEAAEGSDRRRVLRELLYHLGRVVYILDAADDLPEDMKTGAYNPLRYRFSPEGGKLSEEEEKELRLSLRHSHNSISSAFALLDDTPYSSILTNILYIGLPAVTQAVFSGEWRASARKRKERSGL